MEALLEERISSHVMPPATRTVSAESVRKPALPFRAAGGRCEVLGAEHEPAIVITST